MKFLTRYVAADKAGISVSSMKRFEAQGTFPKRVKISESRVGWVESEIDDWIAERIARRDAEIVVA